MVYADDPRYRFVSESALDAALAGFEPGDSLPAGGTAGEVLTKTATGEAWAEPPTGIPSGGTAGQVLTKTPDGEAWAPAPSGLPDGGAEGQVVTKTATGTTWSSIQQNITTNWSKDAQAKAQGYWIVVSPTEPESGTYTTADGVTVPVIWQKPIEKMVPVVPEAPYFDKYALSIQVPDLVGVDYFLTGFVKDGATVDVPDVKIPDGGMLAMSEVGSVPALPYTVRVSARAEPGYVLPSSISWDYSVLDPSQTSLVTSDTFTGRTDGAILRGTSTDAALGGTAKTWDAYWSPTTPGETAVDLVYTVSGGALSIKQASKRAIIGITGVGRNQRVEFDMTVSNDLPFLVGAGGGLWFYLAGNDLGTGGQGALNVGPVYQGEHPISVRGPDSKLEMSLPPRTPAELNGHYVLELFDQSMIVTLPGAAPVTVPITRPDDATRTSFSIQANWSTDTGPGLVTVENLKLSKIGF